jgi:iron complex outermembrane receptor protein
MRRRLLSLHCAIIIASLWPTISIAAATQASPVSVSRDDGIASMPLKEALDILAARTGLRFVYASRILQGVHSKGSPPGLSPAATLQQLLDGTGLGYRFLSATTVTLNRIDADQAPAPAATRPDADEPEALTEVTELEAMFVTGTNIRDVAPVGAPLLVVDAEDIRRSGYSGTEQLVQALPQNFRGGQAGAQADVNMSNGGQRGFNTTAGSGVNLRGLGNTATLVLVNGRRIAASSAGTFTDISLIPIDAIERIEILTDGASAIYGADAVAGVINIILKRDYEGAETRVGYGTTTQGGRNELRVSQTAGRQWDGGGVLLSADYLRQRELMADQRDATDDVEGPTSIFPPNTLKSAVLSANQSIGQSLTLSTDLQYSRADRHLVSTAGGRRSESFGQPVRRNAVISLQYQTPRDWVFDLDGFFSDEDSMSRQAGYDADGELLSTFIQHRTQDQRGAEMRASGPLLRLPAGNAKLALGTTYKEEDYLRTVDLFDIEQRVDRSNSSLFSELYLPLVADANALPGIRQLDMTLAVRRDDYSDFGSSTNPRIGLAWSPSASLVLRSSYSTSFRAPSIGEEVRFSDQGIFALDIEPYFAPDGDGFIPVVTVLGSDDLQPETSRNRTFGVDWTPGFAAGLELGLTYYDIAYSDRIVLPPFDIGALGNAELQQFVTRYDSPEQLRTIIDAYLAQGVILSDFTDGLFGPDPLSQTTTTYSYVWTNADRVDVSGYDVSADYSFDRGESRFELGLNANYIVEMLNRISPTAPAYDLVATFANPPRLRARGSLAWIRRQLATSINVNYTHSYTDTSGNRDRTAASFTTLDSVINYEFAAGRGGVTDGLSLSLLVTNLLDAPPPYVEFGGRGSNYDAGNATPLGRMVSVQFGKRW